MKNMVKSKLKRIKEMKTTITRIDIACASLSMAGLFFQVLQSDEYFSNNGKERYESNSVVLSYRIIVSLLTLILSKARATLIASRVPVPPLATRVQPQQGDGQADKQR